MPFYPSPMNRPALAVAQPYLLFLSIFPSVCLSVRPSVCLSVSLFLCLCTSVCLSVCLLISLCLYLAVCLCGSVYLNVFLSVYLTFWLSVSSTIFKAQPSSDQRPSSAPPECPPARHTGLQLQRLPGSRDQPAGRRSMDRQWWHPLVSLLRHLRPLNRPSAGQ